MGKSCRLLLVLVLLLLSVHRRQRGLFHAKNFEEYAATRVIPARISRARKLMQVHAALLGRIEQQFGVPAPVIVAVWTVESDTGTGRHGQAAGDPHGGDAGA